MMRRLGARLRMLSASRRVELSLGMAGARVLHWNGKDLPEELRDLPAGTYVVEAVAAPALTPDEEQGLAEALSSLRAGEGRTVDQVRKTIGSSIRR
jgi:hypothetical protein